MVYESSYESGRLPFVPDTKRGYWAQPTDFIYACLGLAFKMDMFSMAWFFFFDMGIYSIVPYLICLAIYVVPLFVVQAFLGQFSSSGFISSLRISPLFKGMGYVSLALNTAILMYIGTFAAVPLLFLFHSFRPTLPWSCESFLLWIKDNHPDRYTNSICNITISNDSTTDLKNNTENDSDYYTRRFTIPSVVYFRSLFSNFEFLDEEYGELVWSWQLLFFMFIVWALIALFFYKITDLEKTSIVIRYGVWTITALMLICIMRFSFLPGGKEALQKFFHPKWEAIYVGFGTLPIFVASSFGSGWGNIISLASFNKFQTNIMSYTWIICAGQAFIIVLFGLASFLIIAHFETLSGDKYFMYEQQHWTFYLSSGSAMANMELANMWSILFFSMLTISAMLMMVIQLLALFTAIFDDFDFLRTRKQEVTLGLIGFLALSSIYFCSNHGLYYYPALTVDSLFTQTALNLLLILVVLWIYGRERFQRDIEFMLGQSFATWRIFMLRFVAPIAMLLTLLLSLVDAYQEHLYGSIFVGFIAIFLIVIPWLGVPGYAAFRIFQQTSGSFWERFKRCSHPTDWYPVDADNRQRYEEAIGNADITHQLNEVGDEIL